MKRWTVGIAMLVLLGVASPSPGSIILDDFNDGVLGPAWEVVTQMGGSSWNESGGKLNVGGHIGQPGELVMRYNQTIGDVGSVRIDYSWISYTGHKARVGLGLFDSTWDGVTYPPDTGLREGVWIKGVRYRSTGRHAVDGNVAGANYHIAYNVPTSGSLMIERDFNTFRLSYLQGGNWQTLLETQYDFAGTPLYPYLFTSNSDSYPQWQVALDNFSFQYTDPVPPVPEPSSFAMFLGFGGMGLIAAYRRRKRTA